MYLKTKSLFLLNLFCYLDKKFTFETKYKKHFNLLSPFAMFLSNGDFKSILSLIHNCVLYFTHALMISQ